MNSQRERACGNCNNRQRGQQPLRSYSVDERTSRYLSQQGNQRADTQDEPDIRLNPGLRRQVDGDERNEAGLNISQEKDEPI